VTAERPRNPDGTFAKATPDEEPAEPEPAVEAAAPQDDLRDQMAKLEERLAAKDEFIGRLSNEVGELRAATAPRPEPQQQIDPQAVNAYFDENPHQLVPAIQQAYQTGNRQLLYQGIAKLREYDPAKAEEFTVAVATADAQASVQAAVAPVAEMTQQQHLVQLFNSAAADDPGIAEFIGSEPPSSSQPSSPRLGR
jgi:hypothetical protein